MARKQKPSSAEPSVSRDTALESADQQVTGKNPHAQALGRLGGLKGGKARAAKLTPEQRAEIARKAAAARWAKKTEG